MSNQQVTETKTNDVAPGVQAIMDLHGWETVEEMKADPHYQKTLESVGGVKSKAATALAKRDMAVNGFFLKKIPNYDDNGNIKGHRALVLIDDGNRKFFNVDDDFTAQPLQKVVVDPVTVRISLKNPERPPTIRASKDTLVNLVEHDSPVPAVGIRDAGCRDPETGELSGRAWIRGKRDDWNKGLFPGRAQHFFTGTITEDPQEVFVANEMGGFTKFLHVKVIVTTHEGDRVGVKIPAEIIQEQLGLDLEEDERDEVQEMVLGEPVAVNGDLGFTGMVNAWRDPDTGEAKGGFQDNESALAFCENPDNSHLFDTYEKDGKEFISLNLKNLEADPVIEIEGKEVFDIKRDAKGNWTFTVAADILNQPAWCNVRERKRIIKSGDREGEETTDNEGAFVYFLNYMAGSTETTPDYKDEVAAGLPDL